MGIISDGNAHARPWQASGYIEVTYKATYILYAHTYGIGSDEQNRQKGSKNTTPETLEKSVGIME